MNYCVCNTETRAPSKKLSIHLIEQQKNLQLSSYIFPQQNPKKKKKKKHSKFKQKSKNSNSIEHKDIELTDAQLQNLNDWNFNILKHQQFE